MTARRSRRSRRRRRGRRGRSATGCSGSRACTSRRRRRRRSRDATRRCGGSWACIALACTAARRAYTSRACGSYTSWLRGRAGGRAGGRIWLLLCFPSVAMNPKAGFRGHRPTAPSPPRCHSNLPNHRAQLNQSAERKNERKRKIPGWLVRPLIQSQRSSL